MRSPKTYRVGTHQEGGIQSLLGTGARVVDDLALAEHRHVELGVDQLAVVVHVTDVERAKVPVEALVDELLVGAEVVRVGGVLRLRTRLEGDEVEAVCKFWTMLTNAGFDIHSCWLAFRCTRTVPLIISDALIMESHSSIADGLGAPGAVSIVFVA